MKRFLSSHRNELLAFALLLCTCGVIALWTHYKPSNHYIQLLFAIALLIFAIPLFIVSKKIWREKWREPFFLACKKGFIAASRFVMRFASRFNFLSFWSRGANVINGRTSVSYDLSLLSKDKRRRKKERIKPLRWKDMNTSRERLGYLYYRTVTQKIKSGAVVSSHETPNEIMLRFTENEAENEMFALYSSTRYDTRKPLDEDEILSLKDRLFD